MTPTYKRASKGSAMTKELACQIVRDKHNKIPINEIARNHGVSLSTVNRCGIQTWFFETCDLRRELIANDKAEAAIG